jgi:hypothetical protein
LRSGRDFSTSHHHDLMISGKPYRNPDLGVSRFLSVQDALYYGMVYAPAKVLFCDPAQRLFDVVQRLDGTLYVF